MMPSLDLMRAAFPEGNVSIERSIIEGCSLLRRVYHDGAVRLYRFDVRHPWLYESYDDFEQDLLKEVERARAHLFPEERLEAEHRLIEPHPVNV